MPLKRSLRPDQGPSEFHEGPGQQCERSCERARGQGFLMQPIRLPPPTVPTTRHRSSAALWKGVTDAPIWCQGS